MLLPTSRTRRSGRPRVHRCGSSVTWAICWTGRVSLTRGESIWAASGGLDWDAEVERFFARLEQLDLQLQQPLPREAAEKLIQGPLADALTHVGQLALLRGLHGAPIRPESYARAPIAAGQVGLQQPPPGREFDGDASAR